VRKSLVRPDPSNGRTESRFRLLETVRDYSWERLSLDGEAAVVQQRHAEFMCELVETNYPLNFGPEQGAYGARLERDAPNLRRALDWALDAGRTELALRLGAGLHWFWYGRGSLAEGVAYLLRALQDAEAAPLAARAGALRALGGLLLNQGAYGRATEYLEQAVALDRRGTAEEANQAELAMALGILGVTHIASGRYDDAEVSVRESLGAFEQLVDEWGIATAKEVLGAIAALRGQAEKAESLASEALEVHRRIGSRENIARALDVLGYAAALRGHLVPATAAFEESLSLRRATPNRPATAAVLGRLGLVAYLGQQWQRAATLYRESLALAQEVGDVAGVVRCLGQVAALGLAYGIDRGLVARLGVAVRHHYGILRLPTPPVEKMAGERLSAALRAELSPVGMATAWLSGRGLDLEKTTALGVQILESITARDPASATTPGERLTPREMQVATLIAEGLTNRQIAEELVIAQRTVDTHVERILGKLTFTSRAQVGAWVARQGVLQPRNT
jgi:DNA-binding CsgD family transcriptional regulator/tetratricopeptide (TPR) repeat protein